jgi:hypothetical protein
LALITNGSATAPTAPLTLVSVMFAPVTLTTDGSSPGARSMSPVALMLTLE